MQMSVNGKTNSIIDYSTEKILIVGSDVNDVNAGVYVCKITLTDSQKYFNNYQLVVKIPIFSN